MIKKMSLDIRYAAGGVLEKELVYEGETEQEIAEKIMRDENELLHYMMTEDDGGRKSFVFCGFMFKKAGLAAAQIKEPDF